LSALVVEAFNDLLKKHGKRSAVENPLLLDLLHLASLQIEIPGRRQSSNVVCKQRRPRAESLIVDSPRRFLMRG
jgi:hypothetical protein